MSDYIVSGAKLSCPMGTNTATLNVIPKGVYMNDKAVATMADSIPFVNIGCFGKCNVVPSAPKPCTPTGVWMNVSKDVKVNGIPVLTSDSCIICPLGLGAGMITIKSTGL
ncbi:MAG: DUF4280 domain-containing protein [Lachnospiraceae bacterium]|nr:DUF4280 domain-containing protein [Lachnospiraceae bacterium]